MHSFIPDISIAPLQVHDYSEALPTQHGYCRNSTPKCQRQLRVRDSFKISTWRLERDSYPRPSGRQLSTLPMNNHVPPPLLGINEKTTVSLLALVDVSPAFDMVGPEIKLRRFEFSG